jgi:DNA helicase-2/ATP-dependent DNA helicase PcrA
MGAYETAYAALDTEKQKAVDTIEGPVLVIAGPGTGKTHLLSVRAAHILAKTDTPPETMLCLTFTDSGAQTMRDRIASFVGPAAYDIHISTYHAFGSELIRRYGEYFLEEPGQTPVDDLGIDTLLREIFDSLPFASALKSTRAYLDDIKTFIGDCKRALLTPDDIREIAAQNQTFINNSQNHIVEHLSGLTVINKRTVSRFEDVLHTLLQVKPSQPVRNDIPLLQHQCTAQLEAALQSVEKTGKTTELTKWKNTWLAKDNKGNWILDGTRTCAKLISAADIYERYILALKQTQQYDYDDMIMRAIRGLEENPDLRYTVQERYLYIMLDEFQDTNPAQLRLIQLLTDNPVHEGRPNILAVGDDDQAIYAFQGADYSNMIQFAQMYRDVSIFTLVKNFRSHAHILHVAHNIAGQIEHRLHHSLTGISKILDAENKLLPPQAIVARHEFKTDIAQYHWVAEKIHGLIETGMQASEIAVLAPKHAHLVPLLPFLRRKNVAVHYEKRENILDEPFIKQVTHMCQLIVSLAEENHDQADQLWPEILSYPFWALSTTDIWKISWQAREIRQPWAAVLLEDKNLAPIALFFKRLGLMASVESVETILDYLTGVAPLDLGEPGREGIFTSPLYEYYFGKTTQEQQPVQFWQVLQSLAQLREKLRAYRRNEPAALTLHDLLAFIGGHLTARIGILNTSPYYENEEAVQLMTAYKAKGQEFGAVFVLACIDEAWGSRARNRHTNISLPSNLSFIRYAGASEDERIRLFFVAITRAKSQLYMTSYADSIGGKRTTRLKYLAETDTTKNTSPWLPAPFQAILTDTNEFLTEQEIYDYWQDRHVVALSDTGIRQLLSPRLKELKCSATHLNSFTDLVHGGPAYVYFNTLLKFPKSIGVSGQFGNAIHETLYWMHKQQVQSHKLPSTAQALKTFERLLSTKRLTRLDFTQQLERGERALTLWLKHNSDTFNAQDRHELDFAYDNVHLDGVPLTGKIDRLTIDTSTKTIQVADFKTGRPRTRWQANDIQLHKYRQQLYFYKWLIEKSPQFKGYHVTQGSLIFIEPDNEGNIVEPLTLTFASEELERTRDLIKGVWQHIQDLSFPDTGSYGQSIKSVIAFENDIIQGNI